MAMRIARQRQNLNLPLLNLDFFGCCSLTPFSNSHYLFLRPALKSNCLASIMRWSDPSQMASGNGTNFQWVLDYRSPQLSSPSNLLHTFRERSFHHCSSSLFFPRKSPKYYPSFGIWSFMHITLPLMRWNINPTSLLVTPILLSIDNLLTFISSRLLLLRALLCLSSLIPLLTTKSSEAKALAL